MKRIVTGITATGELTIGNYIGAIKPILKLQKKYKVYLFVADLHALTIDIDPNTLEENRRKILGMYLAAGVDPKKVTIFYQSDVKEHGLMNWILENQTTIGELSRMTQFKDTEKVKVSNNTSKITTGLLTYPTLMAGDILLYNPEFVPTGIDQKQHIELTQNIANRFNNKFGKTFNIPKTLIPENGDKIMSLTNPDKKMSKSDKSNKSFISLFDKPELAKKKILKSVTDSEGKIYVDKTKKKGVTNLLTIYASLKDIKLNEAEKHFSKQNYGEFKNEVGDYVASFLKELQSNFDKYNKIIATIRKNGAKEAKKIASKTLKLVMNKIGLSTIS